MRSTLSCSKIAFSTAPPPSPLDSLDGGDVSSQAIDQHVLDTLAALEVHFAEMTVDTKSSEAASPGVLETPIVDTTAKTNSPDSIESKDIQAMESEAPIVDLASDATDQFSQDTSATHAVEEPIRHEIAFVDARLDDLDQLIGELHAQADDGVDFEIVMIDQNTDGILAIGNYLSASDHRFDAIHIVSHGNEDGFQLGSDWIDSSTLVDRFHDLQGWEVGLEEDADLLIYGCSVAMTDAGQSFLADLAADLNVDIASSYDLTGDQSLGGNWDLEYRLGTFETQGLFNDGSNVEWDHVLATYTVTNTANSGAGSLRQAIIDANANGGADTIVFSISTGVQTITVTSLLPSITGQVTIDGTTQSGYSGTPLIVITGGGTVTDGFQLYIGSDNSTIKGLVIRSFTQDGIDIASSNGNTIIGNYIGIAQTGLSSSGNQQGVNVWAGSNNIIGGSTAAERNIISGNSASGVWIGGGGTGNQVRGNYIGTNYLGAASLANGSHGIYIDSSGNSIGGTVSGYGNVISGNTTGTGIVLTSLATSTTLQGNYVGLNASGTSALANSVGVSLSANNLTIGGTSSAARNIVSGNSGVGIDVYGSGITLQGNYVGLDAVGMNKVANGSYGIDMHTAATNTTIGGTASGAGNIISGNGNAGLLFEVGSSGNVQGNFLGVDASGMTSISGTGATIYIATSNVKVGGTASGAGNVISGSNTHGIIVAGTVSNNSILGNSIWGNSGQGIDLANNGITANDALDVDTGANDLQNFAVITSAASSTTGTTVVGTFNSEANKTYRLEFFTNRPTIADSTNGEGERYLGAVSVTTDGSGNASFNTTIVGSWVNSGDKVSATATRDLGSGSFGSTSEFAANTTATSSGIVVVDTRSDVKDGTVTSISSLGTARGVDGRISLREAIDATNNTTNGGSADRIVFALPDYPNLYSRDFYDSGALSIAIPDNTTVTSTMSVANTGTIRDVNVQLNLNHTYNADVQITLIAPDGTRIALATNNGGANDNFTYTIFDDEATTAVSSGAAPFSGSFRPMGSLAGLDGKAASGTWTLEVKDTATTDTGTLLGWSLGLTTTQPSSQVINVGSALPSVMQALVIDGWSQSGYTSDPILELKGNNTGTAKDGFTLASGSTGSTIRGFIINGFTGDGIEINTSNNNVIEGNWIGLNSAGTSASANSLNGIYAVNSTGLTIGGTSSASRNVIAGNTQRGIYFDNVDSSTVYGNYVGTNAAGTGDINGSTSDSFQSGFVLSNGSSSNIVGNASVSGARNVFSGNNHYGIEITGSTSTSNVVSGNYIGTDATGLVALGNKAGGFSFWGAGTGNALSANVISGNTGYGVLVGNASSSATVQGNYIGLGANGSTIVSNTSNGIYVTGLSTDTLIGSNADGSNDAAEANVVSGNSFGIVVDTASTTGTMIYGNYIGTDSTGLQARGNTNDGVVINNGASATYVGGSGSARRNIIAGNGGDGIQIDGEATDGNFIQNNYIGLGSDGLTILGNTGHGIYISNGADNTTIGGISLGNTIVGSLDTGIFISGSSSGTQILGNYIGTNAAGTIVGGTFNAGIVLNVGASSTSIGGTTTGQGNTITASGTGGVYGQAIAFWSTAGTGNSVIGNSIYGNAGAVGIDLGVDGVTQNDNLDGDSSGANNNLQNFPVMTTATTNAAGTAVTVSGSINTAASLAGVVLHFYATPANGNLNRREGRRYLGSSSSLTTDASGNITFSNLALSAFSGTVAAGEVITANCNRLGKYIRILARYRCYSVDWKQCTQCRSGRLIHWWWSSIEYRRR